MKAWTVVLLGLTIGATGCRQHQPPPPRPPSLGKLVFERVFAPADGLGPLFNANACVECHESPDGGPGDETETAASRGGHTQGEPCDPLLAEGGPVFQQNLTAAAEAEWGITEETPPAGADTGIRGSPDLFGLGIVDDMTDAQILSYVDQDDSDKDGVFGFPNFVAEGVIGRFGSKAQVPTLAEFVALAFRNEMGITTPTVPVDEGANGRPVRPGIDRAPDPELTQGELDSVVAFVKQLRPPARSVNHQGEQLFDKIGCTACHRRNGAYTDVLIHFMGEPGTERDPCFGSAAGPYYRTTPLVGLQFQKGHLMHDGESPSIEAAILRHGGEATRSVDKFKKLPDKKAEALLDFLSAL